MGDKTSQNIELAIVMVLFAAIRFSGYWFYARWLIGRGRAARASPAVVAATRMVIGLVAGAALARIFMRVPSLGSFPVGLLWVPAEFLLRLAIWTGVLRYFFRRVELQSLAPGMLMSYILDVPSAILTAFGLMALMQNTRFC